MLPTIVFCFERALMSQPLLQVIDLKKKYGDTQALKGVSFSVEKGEVFCLLGVNGAGKTTLSSILATLHPATSGDVLYNGKSIYSDLPEYRQHVGYCPQRPNLNPLLTVKENLYFAGKYFGMSDEQISARMHELNQRLGIDEYLTFKSNELSGGWKQRFMIARTLMHTPELVILDEPTVGLDPDIRHQLWYYIQHLKSQGVSVLLTTHYLDEAEKLSDRVCVLDRGEIKVIDTPANLMRSLGKKNLEDVFLHLTRKGE